MSVVTMSVVVLRDIVQVSALRLFVQERIIEKLSVVKSSVTTVTSLGGSGSPKDRLY